MRKTYVTKTKTNNKVCYGIDISENETVTSFPDISDDKEEVEQLAVKLSDADIAFVHIQDIIKDFIAERACDKLIANSLL